MGILYAGQTYQSGMIIMEEPTATTPTSWDACTHQAVLQGKASWSFVSGGATYPTSVFAVGLWEMCLQEPKTFAQANLNSTQNAGMYVTLAAADLSGIFSAIVDHLLWAAQAVPGYPMVSDTISNGYSMVSGTLHVSKGSAGTNGNR